MGWNEQDRRNLDIVAGFIDPDKDQGTSGPPFSFIDAAGGFVWFPLIIGLAFSIAGHKLSPVLLFGLGCGAVCLLLDRIFGFPNRGQKSLGGLQMENYNDDEVSTLKHHPMAERYLSDYKER